MPRKDGLEVVIELMSKRPHPGIIVLSNANVRAMDEFMDSLRDQVPGELFIKPLTPAGH
jgi:hypothetical protein